MDKWPKRQNDGNHCHRPEYRGKNEKKKKKRRQPERSLGQH